ncbi:MAG: ThiF family adenylyltransferase [Planctomycetes bacterium]|nr:ThiF family adenylyltransferase [Planctomycetota bacterium]
MKIKIRESSWRTFTEGMLARTDVETAGIALCRLLDAGEEPLLVVEEIQIVPDEGYAIREGDRLRIEPATLSRMTQRARDEHLAIFTLHTHPNSNAPWFSWADDEGDRRLMPAFHGQVPGLPHGSIVIAQTGEAMARAFDVSGAPSPVTLDVVGKTLRRHRKTKAGPDERFARQRLALGEGGQVVLRDLCVGIVGLGGVGSLISAQVGHHGVGTAVLMDGDVVEPSNLSRVLGSTTADAGHTTKVAVAERYLAAAGCPTRVITQPRFLDRAEDLHLLRQCDVIFACVDRHTPRALLNELAYEANIPVIDIGVGFRIDSHGAVEGSGGRIVVVGPDRPCLLCWDHISPVRLREEAMTAEERAESARQGYLSGADEPQPSVMAFNTMVAGAAMVELLRLVTSFAGGDSPPNRLAFDFARGEVHRNSLQRRPGCATCDPEAARRRPLLLKPDSQGSATASLSSLRGPVR